MSSIDTEHTKPSEDPGFKGREEKETELKRQRDRGTLCVVLAQILLLILPFMATGIVCYFKGKLFEVFVQPEWALAGSVISAQAIVKCVRGYLTTGKSAAEQITLGITAAIFFGFTPSLLVFTLIVNSEQTHATIPLLTLQIIVFVLCLVVFIICEWKVEDLRSEAQYNENTRPRSEVNAPSAPETTGPEFDPAIGIKTYADAEAWEQNLDEKMNLTVWRHCYEEQLAKVIREYYDEQLAKIIREK